jgi:hypothetical protein
MLKLKGQPGWPGRKKTAGREENEMAVYTRYSDLELLKLPDCNGLLENGRCRYMDVPVCLGKNCTFKKSRRQAFERLRSLDEASQAHISKKYYNGHRPWNDHKPI